MLREQPPLGARLARHRTDAAATREHATPPAPLAAAAAAAAAAPPAPAASAAPAAPAAAAVGRGACGDRRGARPEAGSDHQVEQRRGCARDDRGLA